MWGAKSNCLLDVIVAGRLGRRLTAVQEISTPKTFWYREVSAAIHGTQHLARKSINILCELPHTIFMSLS